MLGAERVKQIKPSYVLVPFRQCCVIRMSIWWTKTGVRAYLRHNKWVRARGPSCTSVIDVNRVFLRFNTRFEERVYSN